VKRGDGKTAKPAAGTDAADNSLDFGTSRWRLSNDATSGNCHTEDALKAAIALS
jgi:hypothetical protein